MRNPHRRNWFLAIATVPALLVLLIFAGRDEATVTATDAREEIASDIEVVALITPDGAEAAPLSPFTISARSDEVAVLVELADVSGVPPATTSAPVVGARSGGTAAVTTATTTVQTTTTTQADPVGICVFDNGAIASSIKESNCSGFFTYDSAEANRVAVEIRGGSVTTTADTQAVTTTTAPPTTTTTTTTTTTEPPTTDPTTTTTTTSTTTSTTKKKRGRKPVNSNDENA